MVEDIMLKNFKYKNTEELSRSWVLELDNVLGQQRFPPVALDEISAKFAG